MVLMDRLVSTVGGVAIQGSMLLAPQDQVPTSCVLCPVPCRVQVYEGLNAISEAVGPQFVMAELHKRAAANKNPKVGRRAGNG